MLYSLDKGIRPLSALSGEVYRRVKTRIGRARVQKGARELASAQATEGVLSTLAAEEAENLSRYLLSPDFDHVCFEYALHRRLNYGGSHRQYEEIVTAIRAEIIEGLRHFTSVQPHQRTLLADVLLREIVAGAEVAIPTRGLIPDEIDVSVVGHAAAAGVRNSQLLAKINSLSEIHDFAQQMRAQVRNCLGEMALPHIRGAQKVPYEELWVRPEFGRLGEKAVESAKSPSGPLFEGRNVLLGAPGAGKSTMAQKIALDVASADQEGSALVPFLVVLRNFTAEFQQVGRTLDEFLEMQCADPYGLKPPNDAVPYLLQNGRAVVILDGLDELTRVWLRRRVVDLIEGFTYRYPNASIVVTSRQVGYEYAPLSRKLFSVWKLEPFTDQQVERYVTKWFALDAQQSRSAEAAGSGGRRDSFLRESESIRDIRSNPLMLSLLCGIYLAEHFIPANRADVYRKCAELLFAQWDAMRAVASQDQSVLAARTALQHIAWVFYSETPDAKLSRRHMAEHLKRHFAERFDEDIAAEKAESFLEVCAGRSWVLAQVGSTNTDEIYAFVHRSFLEYFAAEHVSRTCTSVEGLLSKIGDRISRGEWLEVTYLAVQLHVLYKGGAREVAEGLLNGVGPGVRGEPVLAFVAQMLSYTGFPPFLLRAVVDLIVVLAIDNVDDTSNMTVLRDNPLKILLSEASPENLEMIRRAVVETMTKELRTRPSSVIALVVHLEHYLQNASPTRFGFWTRMRDTFIEELPEIALPQNDPRELWFRAWRAQEDLAAAVELVKAFGPASLYADVPLRLGTVRAPVIRLLVHPGDSSPTGESAYALSQVLVQFDTPWVRTLPAGLVSPALAAINGQVDVDLAAHDMETRTLLSLPFLEWVAHPMRRELTTGQRGETVDLGERLTRDIRGHRLLRARRDGHARSDVLAHYREAGCSDDFVRFLVQWVEGHLNTLDSKDVSVPAQYTGSVVVLDD